MRFGNKPLGGRTINAVNIRSQVHPEIPSRIVSIDMNVGGHG
jgi:hypothetical protein